ncbi:MAG: hypothetical protein ACKVX7_09025 [Planctomycetota bacterium]
MSDPGAAHTKIQRALRRIATRCVGRMRVAAASDVLRHGFVPSCIATAAVASVALVFVIAAPTTQIEPAIIQRAALIAFGLPWTLLLGRGARAFLRRRTPAAGLALADQQLDLADRLRTADEFLAAPIVSSFMAAAIDDAARQLERAQGFSPNFPRESSLGTWRAMAWLGLATLCFVSALLIDDPANVAHVADEQAAAVGHANDANSVRETARAERAYKDVASTPQPIAAPTSPVARTRASARRDTTPPTRDEPARSTGLLSPGQSTDAGSSSGRSDASTAATLDAAESRAPELSNKAPARRPRTEHSQTPPTSPRRKNEEPAGSTLGRGAARGTNRNPAASDWASRDQVVSGAEPALENETDVDDDDAESDARGGVQPDLRDRKPPANRDLAIGFGNEPDPDANGRGGASEQKKSRGVASLVLGVPIPDHIKGKPSPGRTKVTQERIQPAAEDADPITAAPRAPRARPAGYVQHSELSPWLRDLVKRYTLSLRHPIVSGE